MKNMAPPINWRMRDEEDRLYAVRLRKLRSVGQYASHLVPFLSDATSSTDGSFGKPPVRFCLQTPSEDPSKFCGGETGEPLNFDFSPEASDIMECETEEEAAGTEASYFLIEALSKAVKGRCAPETHAIWRRIKCHTGRPRLGDLEYMHITIDVVHFLLFRAQVPDLFCAMVHQQHPKKQKHCLRSL